MRRGVRADEHRSLDLLSLILLDRRRRRRRQRPSRDIVRRLLSGYGGCGDALLNTLNCLVDCFVCSQTRVLGGSFGPSECSRIR